MTRVGMVLAAALLAAAPAFARDVTCKDGTISAAGRGACSHHGGAGNGDGEFARKASVAGGEDSVRKAEAPATGEDSVRKGEASATNGEDSVREADAPATNGEDSVRKAEGPARKAPRAVAHGSADSPRSPAGDAANPTPGDSGKATSNRGFWSKVFGKQGTAAQARQAPRPSRSSRARPAGEPTAKCRDGSVSYGAAHGGACSNHGGVAEWLR